MKKIILFTALLGLMTLGLQAQRVGLSANFSSFGIDKVSSGNTTINYQGSTSLNANLRVFSKKKWALRLGAGVDNLNYTVSDGISTDYAVARQDMRGILGLEKHFMLGRKLDIYPGVYIPVVVVGENVVEDNYDNIVGGEVRSGLGVLLGANVRLFRILRLGVEFDASYDHFKEAVWESAQTRSFIPVRGINYSTAFTIGIFL
ncbi:MAG: hypothetical protein AAFY71_05680 [Bacteroidota bacterium]